MKIAAGLSETTENCETGESVLETYSERRLLSARGLSKFIEQKDPTGERFKELVRRVVIERYSHETLLDSQKITE